MADTPLPGGRWAFRPIPPEPRSIVELIRTGVLDAELAATLWLLVEGRVPFVVAGEGQSYGKSTLLRALLAFVPRRSGSSSWPARTRTSPGCRRHPSSAGPDARGPRRFPRRSVPTRRSSLPTNCRTTCRRTRGARRHAWPSARHRSATASPRRSTPMPSTRCSPSSVPRPTTHRRRALAHRRGPRDPPGRPRTPRVSSRPITSVRSRATPTATSSASGRRSSRPGTRGATPSSTSAGA